MIVSQSITTKYYTTCTSACVWMCKITHKHALARRDDKKNMKKKKIGKQAQTSCRHCLVATQETISEATGNRTEGDDIFGHYFNNITFNKLF